MYIYIDSSVVRYLNAFIYYNLIRTNQAPDWSLVLGNNFPELVGGLEILNYF